MQTYTFNRVKNHYDSVNKENIPL